jgi:hypothetical protein
VIHPGESRESTSFLRGRQTRAHLSPSLKAGAYGADPIRPHRAFEERPSFDGLRGPPSPQGEGVQTLVKPFSALANELGSRGFVRTHRSWLVNAGQMTALEPEGSSDYTVELGSLAAPLSRRFPEALARLRGG